MGSGHWSTDVYTAAAGYRAASGKSAFDYSDSGARTVHPELNPDGVFMRESRDSTEHPFSTPIAVLFDVTGSMGSVPRVLQTKLPQLLGLLTRKNYAVDPQILFGAIGDATCDRAPLQVGQFESDNRMDEDLARIVLEGGGGGQKHESYELALYFMARHTILDSMVNRGRKGYLFIIGDEMPYPRVKPREVKAVIGDDLSEPIATEDILTELKRKYDVYYILPTAAHHSGDKEVLSRWRKLLGQNVLELDDLDAVCETIALTVGLGEDAIDLDEGIADLTDVGSRAGGSVGRALAPLQRTAVVRSAFEIAGGPGGNQRL
ncbi:hypothetical protein Aph02nite_36070 [Actinoplanes philippinensis]|uniref:VWFA domain-containing protein n=1 Tax=Actinoplanes philippinensis TaxID=35752 RepID=A0A1I2FE56_9ACTN|nr:hypothetical protein [Actinoplanes philippinensis]GIE77657.1 hypothetical protein Aph02nite_36070 [Actinoplanes philippinensis]SFF03027.1 hypothetical protein SAMN05421541_105297 [Actinoplanes philippinensis]